MQRILLSLGMALAVATCATRTVDPAPKAGSPLAPDTTPVPAPVVGAVLKSDPPLPGEESEAWPGLAPKDTAAPANGHEGGHHHGH